ncbi:MAG TPA: hypothetical protein VK559_01700 [Ferruginibacter sp.]|nr:hypothetical protein [Ferruginibacter sp.]
MKTLLLTISILTISLKTIAQTDISKENFTFSYVKTKSGGRFLYTGSSHSFSVDVVSANIKKTEYPNYIQINDHVVQSSIIPLPESSLDLNALTIDQQKETLDGYVDYELDYFKNDLKLNYQNLKKEWVTSNSKLWLVWYFDLPDLKNAGTTADETTKSQIYASTICFNQVLDLNTPLMQNDTYIKSNALITQLMATLKLSNK